MMYCHSVLCLSAGLLMSATALASPVYPDFNGPVETSCQFSNSTRASLPGPVIRVFLEQDFASKHRAYFSGTPSSPLTQQQVSVVLMDAMEVWNRESRGPVLQFAGDVPFDSITGFESSEGASRVMTELSCSEVATLVPAGSVIVSFHNQCNSPFTNGCPRNVERTNGVFQRIYSVAPNTYDGAYDSVAETFAGSDCADNVRGIGIGASINANAVANINTSHNLKALFVHELGHALGFVDGTSPNISVMAPLNRWKNLVAPSSRRTMRSNSASNDLVNGSRRYIISAPYPEGLAFSGTGPQYNRNDLGVADASTGNRLRRERAHQIHLWPYDVDCVDDRLTPNPLKDGDTRDLNYCSREYNGNTNQFRNLEGTSGGLTAKGMRSGGRFYNPDNSAAYGLFHDFRISQPFPGIHHIRAATSINSNGSIPYGSSFVIAGSNLAFPSIAPTLFAPPERVATNASYRAVMMYAASFRSDISSSTDPNALIATDRDPPVLRQQRGFAIGGSNGSQDLFMCAPGGLVGLCSERVIQSHIPVSAGFDPETGLSVFATVPTRGNCYTEDAYGFGSNLTCGRIYVHPGYHPGKNRTLAKPARFGLTQTLPSYSAPETFADPEPYEFSGRTDVGVGIACAPDDFAGDLPGNANCMVVWMDSGTPDGRMLRGYFHINILGQAIFSNQVDLMEGPNGQDLATVSDISLAFFDGRFWLAWKSAESNRENRAMMLSTRYRRPMYWTENFFTGLASSLAVDAPTFLYDPLSPSSETAMVYTTTNPSCN